VIAGKFDREGTDVETPPARIVSVCGFLKYIGTSFVSAREAVDRYPAEPRSKCVPPPLHRALPTAAPENARAGEDPVIESCLGVALGELVRARGIRPVRDPFVAIPIARIMLPDDWQATRCAKDYRSPDEGLSHERAGSRRPIRPRACPNMGRSTPPRTACCGWCWSSTAITSSTASDIATCTPASRKSSRSTYQQAVTLTDLAWTTWRRSP